MASLPFEPYSYSGSLASQFTILKKKSEKNHNIKKEGLFFNLKEMWALMGTMTLI